MGILGGILGVTGDVTIEQTLVAARPVVVGYGALGFGTGGLSISWAPHAADDIGLLHVESDDAEAVATPSGWTEAPGSPVINATAGTRLTVFWRRAESDAEADVALADPGDHITARLSVLRYISTDADPIDVSESRTTTSGASATVTAPGDTTTVDGCLVCLLFASPTDQSSDDVFVTPINADLSEVRFIESNGTTSGNGGGLGFMVGIKEEAGLFGDTSVTHVDSSGASVAILTTSLMLAFKPAGVPAGAADSVPPVISNVSPEDGTDIRRDTIIGFDITDETSLVSIIVLASFPDGTCEGVYDGSAFRGNYLNSANTVEAITGGFRFTVRRDEGWHQNPTLEYYAVDSGNLAELEA